MPTQISTFNHELETVAHCIPLLQEAGLYDAVLRPGNIFRLHGAVMHDPVVNARHTVAANEYARQAMARGDKNAAIVPGSVLLDVVRAFTAYEKAELKARIEARYVGGK